MDDQERGRILEALDSGDISAGEALKQLQADELAPAATDRKPQGAEGTPAWRRYGWIVLFDVGLVLTAAGIGLATLAGWWWLLAAPLLLIGVIVGGLGLASFRSPWLHVQIENGDSDWPKRLQFALPLPLRPSAWLLRNFGQYVPKFNQTGLDELLIAMSGEISVEDPIVIDVHEGDSGERVRVYFG